MAIELPDLPYDRTALEPHISGDTVDLHRDGHQRTHVELLNELAAGSAFADMELEEVVRTAQGAMAAHAGQAWAMALYWNSIKPSAGGGGGEPAGKLADAMEAAFGGIDGFRRQLTDAALRSFGPGWAWLLQRPDGRLAIGVTPHALTPLTGPDRPLLACSLWEHAYVLDYREDRGKYLEAFWHLVDWDAAASRMA